MLVITSNSFAQLAKSKLPKPGSITGKVIDKKTKEALPYVNIVVRDMANKIITGGITDDNGLFTVSDLPKGNSLVEVQFIGYKMYSKKINITNKSKKIVIKVYLC